MGCCEGFAVEKKTAHPTYKKARERLQVPEKYTKNQRGRGPSGGNKQTEEDGGEYQPS